MLDIMDAMSERLRAGGKVEADDLAQTVEFLRVFVDQCHHTKEEQLLFPAMRAARMTSAEETIVSLLADHTVGRGLVARIAEAARRLAEGDDFGNVQLAAVLSECAQLLRGHIRREEADCFDPADRELPVAVQRELAEGYERVEREVVGAGRHEAFHAMLERLSQSHRV